MPVLHGGEVHSRGLRLTNVIQPGIADSADDLWILPVPRSHHIEVLADGIAFREELFGKVLAHYGYARRMVVVLPLEAPAEKFFPKGDAIGQHLDVMNARNWQN